jgi:uncharacterized protein YciI
MMPAMKVFLLLALTALSFLSVFAAGGLKKQDYFVFLETGKPTPDDDAAVTKMQQGHLANFTRLFGEGKLFAAGPMRDPDGLKRGIIWVEADSKEELMTYFGPDQYIQNGHMTVNATPCRVNKALNTKDIDPSGIEEVRIIQIMRPARTLTAVESEANHAYLQELVDRGRVGGWFTLETGPVAEVLFWNTKDSALVKQVFSFYPSARNGDAEVKIWGQWIGKGVVK